MGGLRTCACAVLVCLTVTHRVRDPMFLFETAGYNLHAAREARAPCARCVVCECVAPGPAAPRSRHTARAKWL